MADWHLEHADKYFRDHGYYEKKHPHELAAVLGNLDTYFKALKVSASPLQVTGGFIHHESDGIKAIDQKGSASKVKLQQTRLYIYPDQGTSTLHVLTIGDKTSQRDDIKVCREFVKKLREDRDEKII